MGRIINWIKNNKLTIILLLVIFYLIFKNFLFSINPIKNQSSYQSTMDFSSAGAPFSKSNNLGVGGFSESALFPQPKPPPTTNVPNRMVIQDSSLSLLVKNVNQARELIIKKAEDLGGYMVNVNIDNPQDGASANITIRVPAKKIDQALNYFRNLAVKVVSENLNGQDVTDRYVDNEARLTTLLKTKAKFEEILDKATRIEDILNVQREIINLQSQIDAIQGQQQYLKQSADLARITIYLSTDELALPYTPSELWRPEVIFKQAIRSLIGSLRKIGTLIIWIVVYSVLWIPLLVIVFLIHRWRKARNKFSDKETALK